MDNKFSYTLVGLFVIILGLALVVSILWLSTSGEKQNYQTYQIYLQESVSGLNVKAPVKYRGVEVGYVRDIALTKERPDEVRVLLYITDEVRLKQDTLAVLSVQGLTGLAHIDLTGSSRDAPFLVAEKGKEYPEVKTKSSLFVRLDTAVSTLFDNLNNVSETTDIFLNGLNPEIATSLLANISNLSQGINLLLSEQNYSAITNILQNFERLSNTLVANSSNVDITLANIVQSTENFSETTQRVNSLLIQLETSLVAIENTSNAATKIASSIEKTSEAFTQTAKVVNKVVQEVEKTTKVIAKTAANISVAVKGSSRDIDYFTGQALPEVTNSLRELRILLASLRSFIQELENKPSMLLFGGKPKPVLGPGE